MKIDVYSNMYNEEVMLPFWLRHYGSFADRIFVWDAGSTDKTRTLLEGHPKVTLLPRDMPSHYDYYYVTKLYPQYEKYSRGVSDWVVIADADEFLYHPHIRKILQKAKKDGIQMIHCIGYSMLANKLPTASGQIYEEITMGVPDAGESKWTIHSPNVTICFRKGRHGRPYNSKQFVGMRSEIKLLHYRYLTKTYIKRRERRNIEGVSLASPNKSWSFTVNGPRTMPNGEKISIFAWLTKHKHEAVNVVKL